MEVFLAEGVVILLAPGAGGGLSEDGLSNGGDSRASNC